MPQCGAHPAGTTSRGLHRPEHHRDGCGIGFVADASGHRSHAILRRALEAVGNLQHRGAVAADRLSGDGAGVLTQLPRSLFRRELEARGSEVAVEDLAVGAVFLWSEGEKERGAALAAVEAELERAGLLPVGWREVPVAEEALGEVASHRRPEILHLLVARPPGSSDDDAFERRLYLARRRFERAVDGLPGTQLHVASLSHRTLVYKGMMVARQLDRFYLDLTDPGYETAIAVFHQRYSTNTDPAWSLAQPFRMLAHNGEINTLLGNRNWMRAREGELTSEVWGDELPELLPVIREGGSDSAMLDNLFELLVLSGRHPLHTALMLVPEACEENPELPPGVAAFYAYHATLVEPWDGPAALVFTDGTIAAGALDRNGLRPLRYWLVEDDLVIVASEAGLLRIPPERILEKGRLGPGEVLCVDTGERRVLTSAEIKERLGRRRPYAAWLERQLGEPPTPSFEAETSAPLPTAEELAPVQLRLGWHREAVEQVVAPMALEGKNPVGSMGDDTPLAVLSEEPQGLYRFFKQRFAQVTNPPIDSLRERSKMSLRVMVGAWGSLLDEREERAHLLHFPSPFLTGGQLAWLVGHPDSAFRSATLPALFGDGSDLESGLRELCRGAEAAVADGATILVLSDREVEGDRLPIPMLLAVSAIHQHLIEAGCRMRVSLVADSGEPREDHDCACLVGFGATLVHPWLAYRTVAAVAAAQEVPAADALARYRGALEQGLLKIMAKMGIGPVSSYQGAQTFEAVGLDPGFVARWFGDTECRLGGVGATGVEGMVRRLRDEARAIGQGTSPALPDRGFYRYRRQGETHGFAPAVVKSLHRAVTGREPESWEEYLETVRGQPVTALRDFLTWCREAEPIPVEEVEPAEQLVRRFCTQAMSHGALSREAHEVLAVAMNRLGARSNSGEGGEDRERYRPYDEQGPRTALASWRPEAGDWGNSAVKQVASGRFGVTAEYLMAARELEIKMAQGAKPGEGGQIPGHKVTAEIAAIRHSVPGVTLISPPPHHDIYSIEDLAQLIYDLKRINPQARVGVKLVAEAGVGTVAAGVAKGFADFITLSGHEGGTGASPLSSLKHAGLPWELGLAETQQVLVDQGLRGRVTLRVDGGLKTGRDVVLGGLLGADEVGFGTAALVASGCIMARQCHLNTCPVGVATQRAELRESFPGTPDRVIAFMLSVAEEVRGYLAELGFTRFEDVIGRVDLLAADRKRLARLREPLDLAPLFFDPDPARRRPRRCLQRRNDRPEDSIPLDDLIADDCEPSVLSPRPVRKRYEVTTRERSLGARLAGRIAARRGDAGLPEGLLRLELTGSAGQSFGAFCTRGMKLILEGEAQDFVGKGMSGGQVIVMPPPEARFTSHENVILGNAALYGATGGSLYAAGRVGERLAVRNSGARAVVEGCGDHGCEYMTGGVVVLLGSTGRNFGAGMSGGLAFVLDLEGGFEGRVNPAMVRIDRVASEIDTVLLQRLVERHLVRTGSQRASWVLDRWSFVVRRFWKVCPYPSMEESGAGEQDLRRLEVDELSRLAAER